MHLICLTSTSSIHSHAANMTSPSLFVKCANLKLFQRLFRLSSLTTENLGKRLDANGKKRGEAEGGCYSDESHT